MSVPLTVIIPTRNRFETLEKCLRALAAQKTDGNDFEVLVVDDGSTDETPRSVPGILAKAPFPGRLLSQAPGGPARARNRGIHEAGGAILLFIGDDIFPAPDFTAHHLKSRSQDTGHPRAVIGKTRWDPELSVTPFMRCLENGIQFSYNEMARGEVSYRYCYTSNVSVPRDFILEQGLLFDENFPHAAFEDIEWGYRLKQAGVRFHYEPDALAYHHHPVTLKQYARRMEISGRALAHLLSLHPGIDLKPPGPRSCWKRLFRNTRARFREAILAHTPLFDFLSDRFGIDRERWVKSVLAYHEEKGFYYRS